MYEWMPVFIIKCFRTTKNKIIIVIAIMVIFKSSFITILWVIDLRWPLLYISETTDYKECDSHKW